MNKAFTPAIRMYHANGKQTGSAVNFCILPASEKNDGKLVVMVAKQKGREFDWDNALPYSLGFADVCKMLQVLRGECASIDNGKGLSEVGQDCRLTFAHLLWIEDDFAGYELSISRGDNENIKFTFTSAEALGLCVVFDQVLWKLTLGA